MDFVINSIRTVIYEECLEFKRRLDVTLFEIDEEYILAELDILSEAIGVTVNKKCGIDPRDTYAWKRKDEILKNKRDHALKEAKLYGMNKITYKDLEDETPEEYLIYNIRIENLNTGYRYAKAEWTRNGFKLVNDNLSEEEIIVGWR